MKTLHLVWVTLATLIVALPAFAAHDPPTMDTYLSPARVAPAAALVDTGTIMVVDLPRARAPTDRQVATIRSIARTPGAILAEIPGGGLVPQGSTIA